MEMVSLIWNINNLLSLKVVEEVAFVSIFQVRRQERNIYIYIYIYGLNCTWLTASLFTRSISTQF